MRPVFGSPAETAQQVVQACRRTPGVPDVWQVQPGGTAPDGFVRLALSSARSETELARALAVLKELCPAA